MLVWASAAGPGLGGLTLDSGIQLFLQELFGGGELAQGDFRRAVALTHRADHLLLLLLVHLGVDVDPRYFSTRKPPTTEQEKRDVYLFWS